MASVTKAIELSTTARLQFQSTIEIINKEFGKKAAEKVIRSIEFRLASISEGKISYRYFFKPKQVRYFITKKNYILYQELKKSILVVGIYNVKQDIQLIKKQFKKL